jgi:Holliday junction resolvase RusA-like endonuclease
MTVVFSLKRPAAHFIANKQGPGRKRKNAPSNHCANKCPDIDNLVKLVLDGLNGLVYADDCQVTSLHAVKVLDDHDECLGSTYVSINVVSTS